MRALTLAAFLFSQSAIASQCDIQTEHDPNAALKKSAELMIESINGLLGTSFRIVPWSKERDPDKNCVPRSSLKGPMLCESFYDLLRNKLKPEEREAALLFVIAHEIAHIFMSKSTVSQENSWKVARRFKVSAAVWQSAVLEPLAEQNVDWLAAKLSVALGRGNPAPAIRYLKAQADMIRKDLGEEANRINTWILERRLASLDQSYKSKFRNYEGYSHISGPCSVYIKDRKFTGIADLFLKSRFKNLPTPLGSECMEFPEHEVDAAETKHWNDLRKIGDPARAIATATSKTGGNVQRR